MRRFMIAMAAGLLIVVSGAASQVEARPWRYGWNRPVYRVPSWGYYYYPRPYYYQPYYYYNYSYWPGYYNYSYSYGYPSYYSGYYAPGFSFWW